MVPRCSVLEHASNPNPMAVQYLGRGTNNHPTCRCFLNIRVLSSKNSPAPRLCAAGLKFLPHPGWGLGTAWAFTCPASHLWEGGDLWMQVIIAMMASCTSIYVGSSSLKYFRSMLRWMSFSSHFYHIVQMALSDYHKITPLLNEHFVCGGGQHH